MSNKNSFKKFVIITIVAILALRFFPLVIRAVGVVATGLRGYGLIAVFFLVWGLWSFAKRRARLSRGKDLSHLRDVTDSARGPQL